MTSVAQNVTAVETFCLDEAELEMLWRTDGIELTPMQQSLLPEIRKWLGRRRNNTLADYLTGKPIQTIAPDVTQELTADVLARFRPQSHGVEALALLTKVIDRGNMAGTFSLCPPPIALLVKRQSSPFRQDRWPTLEIGPRLQGILAQSIRQPTRLKRSVWDAQRVAMMALGQLMVSAIVHGGLISPAVLEALYDQLADGKQILHCLGDRLFVELSIGYQNQPSAEFRRWYPDALTAVLIMKMPTGIGMIAAGNKPPLQKARRTFIWKCIQLFLRASSIPGDLPNSLNALIDAVRLNLESRLPIYLVHYAARTYVSHSLKPSVYRRLHGLPADARLDQQEPAEPEDQLGSPGTGLGDDSEAGSQVEPRWLAALRSAMKGNDRAAIIGQIDHLLQLPAPGFFCGEVGELFAGFARRLLATSNTNKVRMAVSSARAVAISVYVRLGGLVGSDISGFGAEEWVVLYEEAISDAETPGIRRKLVRALRDFHYYLEQERGVEPISGKEVFASANGLVPVDANVVSEVEFKKIRERFSEGIADELPGVVTRQDGHKLAEVAWLILTLAYRCGFRRMEVLKLELSDMLFDGRPEILVRPNESRRLKSKSSTRKLPLQGLLDDDEIERLSRWCEQRRLDESQAHYSNFLFSIPGRGFVFVPQDSLFKLLHRVMRDVTGDMTLRFHHLRHSFASRTMLLLAASTGRVGQSQRIAATLPGYAGPLGSASEFRSQLFGNCFLTRRDLWAVASLLGHSSPDVSVEHYIHHLDILLSEALAYSSAAPETSVVIEASGAPPTQAYRDRQDELLDVWVARLASKRLNLESTVPPKSNSADSESRESVDTPKDDAADSLKRIWQLLLVSQTTDQPLEEIAKRRGIDAARLNAYVHTAHWIASLKLSTPDSRWRHRCIEWTPDRRRPETKRRIACPVKPHEKADSAVLVRLAAAFREAYKVDRVLLKRVVEQYVREVRTTFGGMIFTSPEDPNDAIDFVRCLKLLGCLNSEIEFVSYDVTSKHSIPANAWRRALKIHSSIRIRKASPPNGKKDWACPWLGIQPVFRNSKGTLEGSPAFRFLMVMAAISMRVGP